MRERKGIAMEKNGKTVRLGRLRLRGVDLTAVAVFAVLAACLFGSAAFGITETDEALYQTYVLRLMRGDRFYADDWSLSPFFMIFNYLPFALYYGVTGGAAGSVLALRFVYAALKLAFFAVAYLCLRRFGFWGLLAAAVCAGAMPFGLKTVNYYFVAQCALLPAGALLFLREDERPARSAAAGALFGVAVLAEPSLAAVWAVYGVLVLCRWICGKRNRWFLKNYDFLLSPRVWLHIFYGVLAAAGVFLALAAAFFMRAPLGALLQGFLQALNDPERSGGALQLLAGRLSVIKIYIGIFHPAVFITFFALLAAAPIVRSFTRRFDVLLLAALGAAAAVMCVRLLTYPMETVGFAVGETICHPLPFALLGFVFYAFTGQKDRRLLAWLLFSCAVTVCADMISMSAFGALSELAAVPSALLLRAYVKETRAPAPPEAAKKKKPSPAPKAPVAVRALPVVLGAILVFLPLSEAAHWAYTARLREAERLFVKTDAPLDTVISCGALKGIRTTAALAETYEKSARDAARIGGICEGRLYVADLAPSVYLDADAAVAAHSPYYYYEEGWDRVSLWWRMHPDKLPDAVYIPFEKLSLLEYPDASPEEKLEALRGFAEIEVTQGEIGYIVKIIRWK